MHHVAYTSALSFQEVDAAGTAIGDTEIVEKGQRIPDYVRPFEISALASAGMIVPVADEDDEEPDDLPNFAQQPPALPNPEIPPTLAGGPVLHRLDVGPEDLEAVEGTSYPKGSAERQPVTPAATLAEEPAEGEPEGAVAGKPSTRASKQEWEDYAVSRGVDRAEAESMTKAELIARVEGEEQI